MASPPPGGGVPSSPPAFAPVVFAPVSGNAAVGQPPSSGPDIRADPLAAFTSAMGAAAAQEAEKHRRRAERFQMEYVAPKEERVLKGVEEWQKGQMERYGRKAEAFVTGIDLASPEERAKIEARRAKYGPSVPPPEGPAPGIPHADDPEEAARRAKRAERFGEATAASAAPEDDTMEVDTLVPPHEPPVDSEVRPEALHVYGVDLLNTTEILGYFTSFGPKYVEWIDDSSCNVVFADTTNATRAHVNRGKALDEEDGSVATGLPRGWRRGPDFERGTLKVPLMYRYATAADIKPELLGKTKEKSRRLWRMTPGERKARDRQFKLTGALAPKAGVSKRRGGKKGAKAMDVADAVVNDAVAAAVADVDRRERAGDRNDDGM